MRWRDLIRAAALMLSASVAGADTMGNVDAGRDVFRKHCATCHQIGDTATNKVGPQLNELFDRRAGSVDGFAYSRSLARMGADGLIWRYETLDAYLENPRALVSGTRMSYRGLKDTTARHDLLAFLRSATAQPSDIPESAPTALPSLPAAVLALPGDAEYGAYLSSECTVCHQRDGSDAGIPSITHWPVEDFVVAMHAYKQKLRPHPVMQMMATRLSDEEIAALAAYFATLE